MKSFVTALLFPVAAIGCARNSSLNVNGVSPSPVVKFDKPSMSSTNIAGKIVIADASGATNSETSYSFNGSHGFAKLYDAQGTIGITIGEGEKTTCEVDERATAEKAIIDISVPSDAKAGEVFVTGNLRGSSNATVNTLQRYGFTSSPFKQLKISVLEIDSSHVHGYISAKDQITIYSSDAEGTSLSGEFNFPFCP
jgi:hypothetical protein